MSKIEVMVTITSSPGENLIDLMERAAHKIIQASVDKVVIIHNYRYIITKEKVLFGDA